MSLLDLPNCEVSWIFSVTDCVTRSSKSLPAQARRPRSTDLLVAQLVYFLGLHAVASRRKSGAHTQTASPPADESGNAPASCGRYGPIASLAMSSSGHAGDLVEHRAGLHASRPVVGVRLALAHAGLERLLGDGLVGEDADVHLALATQEVLRRDTAGLDLPGAEIQCGSSACRPYSP